MPPKQKVNRGSAKSKISKPQTLTEKKECSEEIPSLSIETQQQFEMEICWCIQQLQAALKSGKLNPKQVQEHTKALNVLMSNSTPIIKKRQVMRLSFGNYREKMAAEDKKLNLGKAKIKVLEAHPSKKSLFIKKSASNKGDEFKFNFKTPNEDSKLIKDVSNMILTNSNETSNSEVVLQEEIFPKNFHFQSSNNNFKFNFDTSNS